MYSRVRIIRKYENVYTVRTCGKILQTRTTVWLFLARGGGSKLLVNILFSDWGMSAMCTTKVPDWVWQQHFFYALRAQRLSVSNHSLWVTFRRPRDACLH